MKKQSPISLFIAGTLVVSFLAPMQAKALLVDGGAPMADNIVTSELLGIEIQQISNLAGVDVRLVEAVFKTISVETKVKLKEMVALWASQGLLLDPSVQLGIVRNGDKIEILDVAEKDLSKVENDILDLLISLHGESKLVPFISSLIEILKQDSKYGPMVSAVTPDQKIMILSMLDSTIASTGALRKFSKQTWTQLSEQLEAKLNIFEKNKKSQTRLTNPGFMAELLDAANAKFYNSQNTKLLVDGPLSFSLRDQKMSAAKKTINMLTWAVIDDKTGQELADLLIAKAKQDVKVRLIVDGQVSYRPHYSQEVKRMEENGVQVIRWINPKASFMGQHRKMLVIDDKFAIMGGMNPGDTYSHKAGEGKNLWRDTDVAFEGAAAEEAQRLFSKIWNKQVDERNLAFKKITIVNRFTTGADDGKALLVEHQPLATGDEHNVLLTIMKSIRGAEKTVDIENAYVITFPALTYEIKAAIGRGVRVRILTNSTNSVDEKVVALPIMRSAKKLLDVGAEVYLKTGSTLHSKFMIVDQRLFLIGSYNLHPRSEKMEGESIVLFDNTKLALEATAAFENDIQADKAIKMDASQAIEIPVTGETLLPLRMFYDQL
ncbi:MAG: phosphatidylserine/phosphatidylglycerophosphate/cardiolipin synthase family protein [Bdellovibrionota bacterium]